MNSPKDFTQQIKPVYMRQNVIMIGQYYPGMYLDIVHEKLFE